MLYPRFEKGMLMLTSTIKPEAKRQYLQHIEGFLKAEVYVSQTSDGQRIVCKDYSRFRSNPLAAFVAKRLVKREYKALHTLQNWPYAPKVLASSDPLVLQQELIVGKTLASHLANNANKQQIFPSLLQIVQALHLQGIVHNDVRASNIIINKHQQPILIDFTSAHVFSSRHSKIARWLRYHDVRHALKLKQQKGGYLSHRGKRFLQKPKWLKVLQSFWKDTILAWLKNN